MTALNGTRINDHDSQTYTILHFLFWIQLQRTLNMAANWSVLDAIIACRVDNDALFMGETQATRIAEDIFDNVFRHAWI